MPSSGNDVAGDCFPVRDSEEMDGDAASYEYGAEDERAYLQVTGNAALDASRNILGLDGISRSASSLAGGSLHTLVVHFCFGAP